MTDTDVAVRAPNQPRDLRRGPTRIQGRLKAALDKMIWEGMEWDAAAVACNYTRQSMRLMLGRANVIAYLRAEREAFRATVSPRNIHRLKQIRDAADNMPAVNAIKVLEQIDEVFNTPGSAAQTFLSPRLTINIVQSETQPQRNQTPVIEQSQSVIDVPADTQSADRDAAPALGPRSLPNSVDDDLGGEK